MVESAFEKSLQEISRLRHEGNNDCILVYWIRQDLKNALLHQLKNHLSKARINAEVREYTLDQNIENAENSDHALLVLLEKKDTQGGAKDLSIFDSADLSTHDNYYFAAFEIIKKLLPSVNLESVITNFKERSEGMIGSTTATALQVSLENDEVSESKKELPNGKNKIRFKAFLRQESWAFRWSFLVILLFGVGFLIQKTFLTSTHNPTAYLAKSEKEIRSDLIMPIESVLLQRPELMTQIKDAFKKQRTYIQTVALVGLGGAGKTTAARQYAYKQNASVIWEINAETTASLNESFENLAHALSINEEYRGELRGLQEIKNSTEREKKLIEFVKNKLRLRPNWFLVYDNVENFADIQKYFPLDAKTWGHGKIILTTRDSNIQNNKYVNGVLHVGELNENQKLYLFTKIMTQGTQNVFTEGQTNEAKKFLKAIPPFPLDVSLASYYIKTTNIPYNQYIELLEKNDEGITNTQENILKESGDYTKTRYKLVTLSLQKLIAIHKDFEELLLFISLLDSQNIPKKLLNFYKSPGVVDNVIYHLKKHSLITTQSSFSSREPTLSIHRSTQDILLAYFTKKLHLQEKDNHLLIQPIAHSMGNYLEDELDKDAFLRGGQLISHLERFLTHANLLNEPIKASLNAEIAYIYYFFGHYEKTKEILQRSYSTLKKYYGENHVKIGEVLFYLGMVDGELSNYERSKDNLEKSLKIYQKHAPGHHVRIASIIAFLGFIARSQGDYDQAKNAFEKSLKLYQKYCPENHIKIAWVTAHCGALKGEQGHYKKAKELLEQSFAVYKKHFGENHPESMWALVNLGIVYKYLGYYQEARKIFNQALPIYEKHYSKAHIHVAWILTHLGDSHGLLGDHKTAKELQERSVLLFRENFSQHHGPHIDVAWALAYLGNSYKHLNNFKEAKNSLQTSLQAYEKQYGREHTRIAQVLENLGQVYLLEGNLEMAEALLRRALEICQKNNHPSEYICLETFSKLHLKKAEEVAGKSIAEESKHFKTQAMNDLKKALAIVQAHFPVDSPHIARIQNKIKQLEGE